MSIFGTVVVAILTAALSALLAGFVANLAVGWYRISSFEGGSGYFVAFTGLAGLVCGLLIGAVCARIAGPGFLKGLGFAWLVVLLLTGMAAGISRGLADVPPTVKGEQLMLLVEVRWPAAQRNAPAGKHAVELGSLSGNTLRVRKQGPLWIEDARLEDGRWIVPGAVEIFTNRGRRLLRIEPEIEGAKGLLLPTSGTPAARDFSWSEWMPRSLPDGFNYRFKVIRRSQPCRTERIGGFEIDTIAGEFFPNGHGATARFAIRHHGQPVEAVAEVQSVATLPGLPAALLAEASSRCVLLVDESPRTRIVPVSACGSLTAEPLTNDRILRASIAAIKPVQGVIDRETFVQPGAYLFREAIFDSGQRTVRPIHPMDYPGGFNAGVAPLGVSPDGRAVVRAGFSETERDAPALLVFDTEGSAPYLVAIDRAATRYAGADALDPVWLDHYYSWQRADRDVLVARTGIKPLPYRGLLYRESGGNLVYRVQPAGLSMRAALAGFLSASFNARQTPEDEKAYGYQTHIGEAPVHVFFNESEHHVVIYLENQKDEALVPRIAGQFDAVLASGQHDALFEK